MIIRSTYQITVHWRILVFIIIIVMLLPSHQLNDIWDFYAYITSRKTISLA